MGFKLLKSLLQIAEELEKKEETREETDAVYEKIEKKVHRNDEDESWFKEKKHGH